MFMLNKISESESESESDTFVCNHKLCTTIDSPCKLSI